MSEDIKILEKLKETKKIIKKYYGEVIVLKYQITFLPVNTFEQVKEYYENIEEDNKECDVIENLNNLKFKTFIENEENKYMEYTIEFKRDKTTNKDVILINDKTIEYNLESFLPIIRDCFANEDYNFYKKIENEYSNFYKKSENGLNIITMILKNDICKGNKIVDIIRNFIEKENIKPNRDFIKAVCEAGNIDLFKYLFSNYKNLFNEESIIGAYFGGNFEIIHTLENGYYYEIYFNLLQMACITNDVKIINHLLDCYIEIFDIEDKDNIIRLFEYIKNPEVALTFLEKIINITPISLFNSQNP